MRDLILKPFRNILLSIVGERVLAKILFTIADYIAGKTTTSLDDEIVKTWREAYYGKSES